MLNEFPTLLTINNATAIYELMISNVRALKEKLSNDEKGADN